MKQTVFLCGVIILGISGIVFVSQYIMPAITAGGDTDQGEVYLENSGPYIGTATPQQFDILGEGIRIAVIDTGVDFDHPDLYGWSDTNDINDAAKVIGGYNFISGNEPPTDTNGHGTQVAGVIAADGQITGIAPKAKILAYKVSEDGKGVSSELITRAIRQAIADRADIINISLGVNRTNTQIDDAVNDASKHGILVVTAAGNNGPDTHTIGSPGRSLGSITVGATYNNLTSSLVATLQIDDKEYTAIPMTGTVPLDEPITAGVVDGGYGKVDDIKNINVKDKIVIVQRGSDIPGELLYFSIKEENAANAGAKAVLVYNNMPGIFLGELIHEFIRPGYAPQIPVVSMSQEDGQEIVRLLEQNKEIGSLDSNKNEATIDLFYNPDFVAHFSSRGPVSPFYIKPDIVAPGAYINTTHSDYSVTVGEDRVGDQVRAGEGVYSLTSGTSYAAPHVSGAAALLMEKYPDLDNHEIVSLLLTTVEPVSDVYDTEFSLHDAGAGRLDINNAYHADMVITPPNFVTSLTANGSTVQQEFKIRLLGEGDRGGGSGDDSGDDSSNSSDNNNNDNNSITTKDLDITYASPEFIRWTHEMRDENTLHVNMTVTKDGVWGEHQGKIIINHKDTRYTIPFIIHYTQGEISVTQQDQRLHFEISHPDTWNYAKITVTNGNDGTTHKITAATPTNNAASVQIYENAEYWINAKIRVNGTVTSDAYNTITVTSLDEYGGGGDTAIMISASDIIQTKPLVIITGILVGIFAIGISLRRAR